MFSYTLKEQGIDIVDTVLTNRGLTLESANLIINATFNDYVGGAYQLKNIDKAVKILNNAIKNRFKIGILIDSDCDGYCAAAMMYDYLKNKIGYENVIYKFHEKHKAHGIKDYVVEWVNNEDIKLLIIPDAGCGASDEDPQKFLSSLGVNILILDHHIPEYIPCENVAMVNPHQSDDVYHNKYLSGAGVTHKFIEYHLATITGEDICVSELYDDLVALSLVSDMMNLRDSIENRAYLNSGSMSIKAPFLSAIFSNVDSKKLSIQDLGFSVAPLINATVRFGNDEERNLVFRSLFEEDTVLSKKRGMVGKPVSISIEAVRIAGNLKRKQDKERDKASKTLCNLIEELKINKNKVIILTIDDNIDNFITGLIANKLVNIYNKPVMLLRETENIDMLSNNTECSTIFAGSVRTVNNNPKLKNFKSICLNTGLFEYCSGHEGSFGAGITNENLKKLNNVFNEMFEDINVNTSYEVEGIYNQKVPFSDIRDISTLEDLWCFDIKEPLFLVKNVKINTDDIKKIGNATYTFNFNKTIFTKFYGSKVWFSNFKLENELPFGGDIEVDIICKFKKVKNNSNETYIAEIVDTISRVNVEYDF